MTGNAGPSLDTENVFCGDALGTLQPLPNRGLSDAADPSEGRLRPSSFDCLLKGFVGSEDIGHNPHYSERNNSVKGKSKVSDYSKRNIYASMRTGERIAARRAELGLSQSLLAKMAGVSQATIGKLESGISSGSSQIHKIARALQTTAEFLTGETDDPAAGAPVAPTPEMVADQLGMTLIPEIDLHFALGGGNFVETYVNTSMVPYRTDWLGRITRGQSADVFLTRGDGDSMMPTILDEDDVIVNRADRIITKQDRVWALGYGDLVSIKRVRRLADGTFQLNSDNPNVSPIVAYEDELRVIGRVVWIGRRM